MTGNKINDYSNPSGGNPVQMPPVWKYFSVWNARSMTPHYQKMIVQAGKDKNTCLNCYVQVYNNGLSVLVEFPESCKIPQAMLQLTENVEGQVGKNCSHLPFTCSHPHPHLTKTTFSFKCSSFFENLLPLPTLTHTYTKNTQN